MQEAKMIMEAQNKFGWKQWRKFFNDIHLWLGIASGIVLFIVCLTGTIYTFKQEVEELFAPSLYKVNPTEGSIALPTDELAQKVAQETGGQVTSISIPQDKKKSYSISVKTSENERRGTSYFVNQYTAEVLGVQDASVSDFFLTVMKLHRWLLIEGDTGKIIVGISTIIFIFLTLTGMVIWFPIKLKNWKQGLKIKMNANWKRINHDLHNTLGFYSFFLLLIMGLTGLCWSFGWYKDGLSKIMGSEVFGARREKPMTSIVPEHLEDAKVMSISHYIAVTDSLLPYPGNYRISIPSSPEGSVSVTKSKNGFFAIASSDRVQIDQYSGLPLKVERYSDKALNEQIVSLIRPLHTGEVMGMFSKILYFLACLFATSLPVTGTIIWINKLKKKKKKRGKKLYKKNSIRNDKQEAVLAE